MTSTSVRGRPSTFLRVLRFAWGHLRRQPGRALLTAGAVALAALGGALMPLYAGRLVDAVAEGGRRRAATRPRSSPR